MFIEASGDPNLGIPQRGSLLSLPSCVKEQECVLVGEECIFRCTQPTTSEGKTLYRNPETHKHTEHTDKQYGLCRGGGKPAHNIVIDEHLARGIV